MKSSGLALLGLLPLISGTLRADYYGTGFFISPDGHLVTNAHVVEGEGKASIRFKEEWIPAKVVREDPANDIAILAADGEDYPTVPLQSIADVRPGDETFTIGFPDPAVLGFAPKTTRGEVSALSGIKDDVRYY